MCEPLTNNDNNGNKCRKNTKNFRIENNILIGQEISIDKKPVNIAEVILEVLKGKPDFIGQVDAFTGKVSTYADMSERSIKCALWLRRQGVKPRDVIGLCTDNNLDAITLLLGTLYVGAICNAWDHILSPTTARYFLMLSSPKVIFTMSLSAAALTSVINDLEMNTKIVVIDELDGYESLEDILKGHDTRDIVEFKCTPIDNPNDTAIIFLSSGTTGMPKGTAISHFSMKSSQLTMKMVSPENESSVCMFTPTLRWCYGTIMAVKAIMMYSTRIVIPDFDDIEAICQFIEKYRVTWYNSDPYMLIKYLKNEKLVDKYRFPNLKKIGSSGAHLSKEYQEMLRKLLPHVHIINTYGMTDAGSICCLQTEDSKLGSIGFVVPGVRLKITDLKTEEILGANQNGEIRLKLPSIMSGYYKNPELTRKAFDSDGWLCTGDVGIYDDDGEVFLTNRISEFILFRSINVSVTEIESLLMTHPAVQQAAVIGIPHEIDEQQPMAIISRVSDKTVTETELIDLVENNLPDYCRLRGGVKFMDSIPLTGTKKIARKELETIIKESACTENRIL